VSGWLALVGGAEWTDGCRSFDEVLLRESGGDEVLVVPTAAAYEHPERLIDAATAYFATLGAKVRALDVLARPAAGDARNADVARAARFIYLAGESPLHLRSVFKDTPVWDALSEAWQAGASVAGASAGAMALGDPMVDPRGGAFTLGLGLVPSLAVMAHVRSWSPETRRRTIQLAPKGVPLVAIDEATAALRSPDGVWSSVGVGAATVWCDGADVELSRLP